MARSGVVRHGHTVGHWSPTYTVWVSVMQRCTNPKSTVYAYYGGRGITICERWKKFDYFLEDMGERPDGHSIERLDNEQGYHPGNCVWLPRKEQSRNRRSNQLTMEKANAIRAKADELGSKRAAARWAQETFGCTVYAARHVFRGTWA